MTPRLPLSVIVTTVEPWPDLSHLLEVLHPQVEAYGGEIIIASSDREAPSERVIHDTPRGRWLRRRDTTVPRLRAMAAEIARGEIIATTEDDCLVADDWCAAVMRGFALYPLAKAITGVTGEDAATVDDAPRASRWSSAPARPVPGGLATLNANIAYQRSVFPPVTIATGWIERDLNPRLLREGAVMVHDTMVVYRTRRLGMPGRPVRLATGSGH